MKQIISEVSLTTALLDDLRILHPEVYSSHAHQRDTDLVSVCACAYGRKFFTELLPKLGKALDRALSTTAPIVGFAPFIGIDENPIPVFLKELFEAVLDQEGKMLPAPCVQSVRSIRQIAYCFYKYELPYTNEQEQQVITRFLQTEADLAHVNAHVDNIVSCELHHLYAIRPPKSGRTDVEVAREARRLLHGVFQHLDLRNIIPRHGPGAVATKQRLWDKYRWTNVSDRITNVFPLDAFFYASLGHVCDDYRRFEKITGLDLPARVVLVPKDSRGPRLISCEPVDFQWVQQGVKDVIVSRVEHCALTKHNVFFTNQQPNQIGALLGSQSGQYATLDLNEASDRVSVALVRLLFPAHVSDVLCSCRSLSTMLPNGDVVPLRKYAPMGSALCFPVLALTVWSLLTAVAPDKDTRERILVYGDDVIVPTQFAPKAIEVLELFGLKVNRDKSCTSGLFRESCGQDALLGQSVTPVRLRTVWSSHPTVDAYVSWISYANSFYDRRCFTVYERIVEGLVSVYGAIPCDDMHLACPSLREASTLTHTLRQRTHADYQKRQFRVRTVKAKRVKGPKDLGWINLLRYFTEARRPKPSVFELDRVETHDLTMGQDHPFRADTYTPRDASMLVWRWL